MGGVILNKLRDAQMDKKLPAFLRNPKVHYRDHESLTLITVLSQVIEIHALISYLPKSILILSSHLRLMLSSGPFPLRVIKILYEFDISFIRAICLVHLILPD
jgi:hypothetical protein